jgi:DNA polymerase V
MNNALIGLLDCNNFFVSCERVFRPDLNHRPVVVLSSNDGCVVARSSEVKDMGIPMGVPYFQVKDILRKSSTAVFSSHFALYRDLSKRVFSVMRDVLEVVEEYSIDEAFFIYKGEPCLFAKELKERIKKEVGIPVSIGFGSTKTQAKYANALAKKSSGIRVLYPPEWAELQTEIPLRDVWGVGKSTAEAMRRHGLNTVFDLLSVPADRVRKVFGLEGARLQAELGGLSAFSVNNISTPVQSMTSSRSLKTPTKDISVLSDAVSYHTRHLAHELRVKELVTGLVKVFIMPSRHGEFVLRSAAKQVVLPNNTNNTITLLRVANQMLSEMHDPEVPYNKVGVAFASLQSTDLSQNTLFDTERKEDNNALMQTVDRINSQAGKELLLWGSRLKVSAWQSRSEACSPGYTTRWSEIATVKAN